MVGTPVFSAGGVFPASQGTAQSETLMVTEEDGLVQGATAPVVVKVKTYSPSGRLLKFTIFCPLKGTLF